MKKKVSQRALAERLGISQMTVSRALRGSEGLSSELRDRILSTSRQMGYPIRRRNQGAGSLLNVICSIVNTDLDERKMGFHTRILQGMQECAAEEGSELHNFGMNTKKWPQLVQRQQVDGVIFLYGGVEDDRPSGTCPLPLVSIFSPLNDDSDVVTIDGFTGGRTLANHLAELGHRQIAFIGPDTDLSLDRMAGLRVGLQVKGGDIPNELAILRPRAGSRDSVDQMLSELLGDDLHPETLRKKCTAVACYNDYMAREAVTWLRGKGLRVPEDMSVTGFDGVRFPESNEINPSTMVIPLAQLGSEAVFLLHWRIQHPKAPRRRLIVDVTFQQGNTTGPAPTG